MNAMGGACSFPSSTTLNGPAAAAAAGAVLALGGGPTDTLPLSFAGDVDVALGAVDPGSEHASGKDKTTSHAFDRWVIEILPRGWSASATREPFRRSRT